jgi:glutamine amidotransferase-like uncharacterized protein
MGFLKSLEIEKGCKEIQKFIEKGGNYLGICAGSAIV